MAYSSIIRRPLKDSENLHRTSCRMTCCDAFDRQNKLIDKQFMMENVRAIFVSQILTILYFLGEWNFESGKNFAASKESKPASWNKEAESNCQDYKRQLPKG